LRGNTILAVNVGTYPDIDLHPEQANIHASVYFYRVFINQQLAD
jgi:hypothetical protein